MPKYDQDVSCYFESERSSMVAPPQDNAVVVVIEEEEEEEQGRRRRRRRGSRDKKRLGTTSEHKVGTILLYLLLDKEGFEKNLLLRKACCLFVM
jgi:hypothetical protein